MFICWALEGQSQSFLNREKLNIPIIEDACEIVGGFNEKGYGTLGDIGVFSFDFGKNICGEGGMLQQIIRSIMIMLDHNRSWS